MSTNTRFVWVENKSNKFIKFSLAYSENSDAKIQSTDPIPFYCSKKLYIPDDSKSVDVTVYFLENGLEWVEIFTKTFKDVGDIGLDVMGPNTSPLYKVKDL
ncbi:MAG: hypothetical protein RR840_01030 [Clostridium sp.]